jgi:hypothetical protein
MIRFLRAVAGFAVAATLVPGPPASANWHCQYFKWDAAARKWRWVEVLQPQEEYEAAHPRYTTWDCRYCYVPAIVAPPDLEPTLPAEVEAALEPLRQPARDAVAAVDAMVGEPGEPLGVDFGGPDCPDVPPVWDLEI